MLSFLLAITSQLTCEQTKAAYTNAECCDSSTGKLVDLSFLSPPSSPPAPPPPISNSDLIKQMLGEGGMSAFSHGQRTIDIITDVMVGDMSLINNKFFWFKDLSNLSFSLSTAAIAYTNSYYDHVLKKCDHNLNATVTTPINIARASVLKGFILGHRAAFSENREELQEAEILVTTSLSALQQYVRSDVSEIDSTVATVVLANIQAMLGKWDDVIENLKKIVNPESDFRIMNRDEIKSMNNVYALKSSVIWGYDMTKELDILSFGSVYGLTDFYTYGYQWAGERRAMNENVYTGMSANDTRRNQFFNHPEPSDPFHAYHLTQSDKFTTKTQSGQKIAGNKDDMENMDYIFIRYAEAVLLLSEAYLHKKNYAKLSQTIAPLILARLPENEAHQVIDDIANACSICKNHHLKKLVFDEWRREFWAEGKVLFAMKRLQQSVQRDQRSVYLANQVIYHDDPRLILPGLPTLPSK